MQALNHSFLKLVAGGEKWCWPIIKAVSNVKPISWQSAMMANEIQRQQIGDLMKKSISHSHMRLLEGRQLSPGFCEESDWCMPSCSMAATC